MNFSALSIRNPIPAILLFALLTFAGILAFKANKVQFFQIGRASCRERV